MDAHPPAPELARLVDARRRDQWRRLGVYRRQQLLLRVGGWLLLLAILALLSACTYRVWSGGTLMVWSGFWVGCQQVLLGVGIGALSLPLKALSRRLETRARLLQARYDEDLLRYFDLPPLERPKSGSYSIAADRGPDQGQPSQFHREWPDVSRQMERTKRVRTLRWQLVELNAYLIAPLSCFTACAFLVSVLSYVGLRVMVRGLAFPMELLGAVILAALCIPCWSARTHLRREIVDVENLLEAEEQGPG